MLKEASAPLLEHWHEFYLLVGTAAAALVALLFVAASIGAGMLASHPTGPTRTYMSPIAFHFTSALFVCMWGYFLYQGVTDPLGGINSLWPLFGISNQLLATVALCVGTTIIIKMGKQKYAYVTLIPMTWLVIVTMTAGITKVFSSDPKMGFLAHARVISEQIATNTLPANIKSVEAAQRMIFNDRLDAGVAIFFLISVVVILGASINEWMKVTSGKKAAQTSESPFVLTQLREEAA